MELVQIDPDLEKLILNKDAEGLKRFVYDLEAKIRLMPEAKEPDEYPLKHSFAQGQYIREIFVPGGDLVVTKTHKYDHACFVLRGDCSVLTEKGIERVTAPYYMITKSGTKRVVYVHEDTVWVTVHTTNETDISKIEDEIYTEDLLTISIKGDVLCLV